MWVAPAQGWSELSTRLPRAALLTVDAREHLRGLPNRDGLHL